jgi:HD-GYP domain-containing protein (c-di-GMP phosphodiesterase class II)
LRSSDVHRTPLSRYAFYMVATTIVLFAFPLFAAYRLSTPPFQFGLPITVLVGTLTSVGLGRIGAAMWQRHPGSRDVVFDDLLLWGFARRIRNERRRIRNAALLMKGLSRNDRLEALQKIAKSLETGDPYTHGHSDRVARHSYMIARAMKLPREYREKVRLAGALHDVGKLSTPREVLTKPDRLTDEEFAIIKRHPGDGADMLVELGDDELTAMVRHHHERMDGTGYPHQLKGNDIPLGARIISVADTFDAITSKRAYRPARKHKDAIDILQKEAGSQLDGDVVKAFIAYYTGRRGIRLWLSVTSTAPRVVDAAIEAARTAIANAAVVGGAAAVVVSGAGGIHSAPQHKAPAVSQVQTGSTTGSIGGDDSDGGGGGTEVSKANNGKPVVIGSGSVDNGKGGNDRERGELEETDESASGAGNGGSGGDSSSGETPSAGSDEQPTAGEAPPASDDSSGGDAPADGSSSQEPPASEPPADSSPPADSGDPIAVPEPEPPASGGGGGSGDGGGGLIEDIIDVVDDTLPLN